MPKNPKSTHIPRSWPPETAAESYSLIQRHAKKLDREGSSDNDAREFVHDFPQSLAISATKGSAKQTFEITQSSVSASDTAYRRGKECLAKKQFHDACEFFSQSLSHSRLANRKAHLGRAWAFLGLARLPEATQMLLCHLAHNASKSTYSVETWKFIVVLCKKQGMSSAAYAFSKYASRKFPEHQDFFTQQTFLSMSREGQSPLLRLPLELIGHIAQFGSDVPTPRWDKFRKPIVEGRRFLSTMSQVCQQFREALFKRPSLYGKVLMFPSSAQGWWYRLGLALFHAGGSGWIANLAKLGRMSSHDIVQILNSGRESLIEQFILAPVAQRSISSPFRGIALDSPILASQREILRAIVDQATTILWSFHALDILVASLATSGLPTIEFLRLETDFHDGWGPTQPNGAPSVPPVSRRISHEAIVKTSDAPSSFGYALLTELLSLPSLHVSSNVNWNAVQKMPTQASPVEMSLVKSQNVHALLPHYSFAKLMYLDLSGCRIDIGILQRLCDTASNLRALILNYVRINSETMPVVELPDHLLHFEAKGAGWLSVPVLESLKAVKTMNIESAPLNAALLSAIVSCSKRMVSAHGDQCTLDLSRCSIPLDFFHLLRSILGSSLRVTPVEDVVTHAVPVYSSSTRSVQQIRRRAFQ